MSNYKLSLKSIARAHSGFGLALSVAVLVWLLYDQDLLSRGETVALYATANLTIVAGYLFAAVAVGPRFRGVDMSTKVGGFWFFALCGITHLELAIHALFDDDGLSIDDMLGAHNIVHMIVQSWAIWEFLFGLSRHFKELETRETGSPRRRWSDSGSPGAR